MKCKTIVESSKHDIAMAKQGAAVSKMKEIKKTDQKCPLSINTIYNKKL